MTTLKLDWCSYEAAKYACEHWHYSKTVPRGRINAIGVWENNNFIGAVIFGHGATQAPAHSIGLTQWEAVELQRVALKEHKTPVSKIVSIALKILKAHNPDIRAVVSYADPAHGHIGAIYQAGNWLFTGMSGGGTEYFWKGEWVHSRAIGHTSKRLGINRAKLADDKRLVPAKYRYVVPLDDAMCQQIEPLRKPYPKRGAGETDNAAQSNAQTGGASPTAPLLDLTGGVPELIQNNNSTS